MRSTRPTIPCELAPHPDHLLQHRLLRWGRTPGRQAAAPSDTAARILALQRSVREPQRRRHDPAADPDQGPIAPEAEPGGNLASASEEAAGLAAEAQRRATRAGCCPQRSRSSTAARPTPAAGLGLVIATGTSTSTGWTGWAASACRRGLRVPPIRDPASAGCAPELRARLARRPGRADHRPRDGHGRDRRRRLHAQMAVYSIAARSASRPEVPRGLGPVALLELLARPAPAGVVAADLLVLVSRRCAT